MKFIRKITSEAKQFIEDAIDIECRNSCFAQKSCLFET